MKKYKIYIFPLIILYLSIICLFVVYIYFTVRLNANHSIYLPYKSFNQISPIMLNNVIITIIKVIFGLTGFIIFIFKSKINNFFTTTFLLLNIFEILLLCYMNFFAHTYSFDYIDKFSVIYSSILFSIIMFFYTYRFKIEKIILSACLSLFITIISYYFQ